MKRNKDAEIARTTLARLNAARDVYCERHGLVPVNIRAICAHRLLDRACTGGVTCLPRDPEFLWDHVRTYRHIKSGALVLTTQPYAAPKRYGPIANAAAAWAKRFDLYWRVSNEQQWWSERALLIEFWGRQPEEDTRG